MQFCQAGYIYIQFYYPGDPKKQNLCVNVGFFRYAVILLTSCLQTSKYFSFLRLRLWLKKKKCSFPEENQMFKFYSQKWCWCWFFFLKVTAICKLKFCFSSPLGSVGMSTLLSGRNPENLIFEEKCSIRKENITMLAKLRSKVMLLSHSYIYFKNGFCSF